jgi:hypothetical protein
VRARVRPLRRRERRADGAIVERIRADRIAVLVDLNGYTQHSREQIFALRPARSRSTTWATRNAGRRLVRLCAGRPFSAPDALQPFFTERLLQLPHMSFPSNPAASRGTPPTRAECGLPDDAFVFACFNNAFKILPDVFRGVDAAAARSREACSGCSRPAPSRGEPAPRSASGRDRPGAARVRSRASLRWSVTSRASPQRHLVVDSFPYGAHTTAKRPPARRRGRSSPVG